MANPIKIGQGIVRLVGGIVGKGGRNVAPLYKETGNSVKVIKAGTKPLTMPTKPFINGKRSEADISRMRGTHPGWDMRK